MGAVLMSRIKDSQQTYYTKQYMANINIVDSHQDSPVLHRPKGLDRVKALGCEGEGVHWDRMES